MHRRTFIRNSALLSTGILISSSLIYCSGKKISLDDCIGKNKNILDGFPVEGDSYFSYYTLPQSKFSHSNFSGEQAFVFCKNNKIVGYTIKMNGTDDVENYMSKLSQKYGVQKKVFENDFGEEFSWETDSRKFSLTYAKNYPNVPKNTYFSEAVLKNGLMVF